MKSLVAKWGSKETSRCECECKRKVDFRQPILDNILNMTQHWGENSKAPLFPSSSNPPPSPALPARPHLPFTLCALTSLPMRVIGIFKRWRGQKGTQPHPENLIGESLEAQHSKGESLLNYIYIHTYSFFHSRSVSILSLFQRLFIITWESDRNIFHSDIISLFFLLFTGPSPHRHFFWHFHFFLNLLLVIPTFSLTFIPSHSNFIYFYFSLPFEPSDVQLTLEHWGFTCGNISVDLSSDYSIEHLTDIFTKSFLTQVTETFTDDKTNKEVSETKAYLHVRCY